MAFDAFCYFPKDMATMKGETQDDDFSKKKAFEILSFEIGAENTVDIGSRTGGAGAGKATFKEGNMTKKTDSCSCELFKRLCVGEHFEEMVIELRRQAGSKAGGGKSGLTFLMWEFKLVFIQDISWTGSDGDDVCEETVVYQYGALKVTYSAQDKTGAMPTKFSAEWSRVKNKASFVV